MKRAQGVVKRFSKSVGRLGATVAAAFSITAVVGYTRALLRMGDALAKTSRKLGIATEELAGLQFAAKLSGVAVRTFDMGLQRMVRRIAEAAQDTGEAKQAIKDLGLDARILAAAGPGEAFRMIADAMAKVTSQGERVRLAFKLFDSEGVALLNTLQLTRAGLDQAREKVDEYGTALSRVNAKNIEAVNDAFTETAEILKGAGFQVLNEITPALKGLPVLTAFVIDFNKFANELVRVLGILTRTPGFQGKLINTLDKAEKQARQVEEIMANLGTDVGEATPLAVIKRQEEIAKSIKAQWDDLFKFGQRVFDETRTPMEQFTAQMQKLDTAVMNGAVTWDTYWRAADKAREALADTRDSPQTTAFIQKAEERIDRILEIQRELRGLRPISFGPGAFRQIRGSEVGVSGLNAQRRKPQTVTNKADDRRDKLLQEQNRLLARQSEGATAG
jgi:hypothetical protein